MYKTSHRIDVALKIKITILIANIKSLPPKNKLDQLIFRHKQSQHMENITKTNSEDRHVLKHRFNYNEIAIEFFENSPIVIKLAPAQRSRFDQPLSAAILSISLRSAGRIYIRFTAWIFLGKNIFAIQSQKNI